MPFQENMSGVMIVWSVDGGESLKKSPSKSLLTNALSTSAIGCCKSAGLGGKTFRDGSAAYYLMGQDTEPTVADPTSPSFYTEGKVLGAFILAATEYERMKDR